MCCIAYITKLETLGFKMQNLKAKVSIISKMDFITHAITELSEAASRLLYLPLQIEILLKYLVSMEILQQ